MRPWVLLTEFGIPFDEVMLKFDSAEWDKELPHWSPSKLVPVLWNGEPTPLPTPSPLPSKATWESTAIFEMIAEAFPQHAIWPRDAAARNHARSIVAEMHAGFRPLRTHMPMNIRATMPGLGLTPEVAKNIERIEAIWREARTHFGSKNAIPVFVRRILGG